MCWISYKKPQLLKAEKDIEVIKVITITNRSVYFRHKYRKGKTQPIVPLNFLSVYNKLYCVTKGYHSYMPDKVEITSSLQTGFLTESIKSLLIYEKDKNDLIDTIYCANNLKVQYFVIPKGTAYCINERGEVVSETIKMI